MVQVKTVKARGNPIEKLIPSRYIFAVLGCIGMGIIYGLKVNLSVGIVSMVNYTALEEHAADHQKGENVTNNKEDGPFVWNPSLQGYILGSYFCGYLVTQLPGGRLAELFSAKWVFFFAVAINIICTLLTPVFTELHISGIFLMRILEGVGGGVTFPSMHVLLAHWAPTSERGSMSSIVYAGTSLGTVIFTLTTGFIAEAYGWASIFYIQGAFSALWLIFWYIFVADSPDGLWFISENERDFINKSLNQNKKDVNETEMKKSNKKVPWKKVWRSVPFWAILIAHICSNWGWYTILMELPNYMKHVLKFKISGNALMSSLPFFTMWLFSIIISKVLDALRSKGTITMTASKKIATLISCLVPMICFVGLSLVESQRNLALVLMTLAVTAIGGMFCGYLSNHIDISPNFAGTLVAMTNTFATIPGIVVPVFVGKLTEADKSIRSWRIIFGTVICLYIVEAIIYGIFASGDVQEWNKIENEEDGDNVEEEQPLRRINNSS